MIPTVITSKNDTKANEDPFKIEYEIISVLEGIMTPKKVWAIIIIVVGIYMIYIGATKCYEADFLGHEIRHIDKQLAQFGGSKFFGYIRLSQIASTS